MLGFIRKTLELKIIVALCLVVGSIIGIFTIIDIGTMRVDTIQATSGSLKALAASVKGNVTASMKKGHREDVQRIIEEVRIPHLIDRILIYSEEGTALKYSGDIIDKKPSGPLAIPPEILRRVQSGEYTLVQRENSGYVLSFYSPIPNKPECYGCHGRNTQLNGILRIDFSLHSIDEVIAARRNRVILLAAVMLLSLVVSLVLLLRVLVHRPVNELMEAMERTAFESGAPSLDVRGEDEFAELKRGFLSMVGTLQFFHKATLEKERELARSQEMNRFRFELQAMFDAMPDGVLLVDRALRIIYSNPRAYELLSQLKETAGRMDAERMEDASCPNHGIKRAFEEMKTCEHQCDIRLPDGETRHLHSICAPILGEDGEVVHVVEVIRDITSRVKTEHELEEKTSELMQLNRLLSQIAITDSLTQVYNRRHLDELLYKEIKRYNRRKYIHLSLMMIDIDRFKELNDRYGHLMGDTVLRELAKMLKENVRDTDTVARYGGEEFVVVMPDAHIDSAMQKAEALRRKVSEKEFPGHGRPVHITISIGVAAYKGGTPHDLIHEADHALYEAKKRGRDRVVTAPV